MSGVVAPGIEEFVRLLSECLSRFLCDGVGLFEMPMSGCRKGRAVIQYVWYLVRCSGQKGQAVADRIQSRLRRWMYGAVFMCLRTLAAMLA